jgi:hypothetical protein
VLISQRGAAELLADSGVARRQARQVLAAGLAGPPVRAAGALLYERDRVRELARRPRASAALVDEACPWGLFVARRFVDVTQAVAVQREAASDGWDFSIWTSVWLRFHIQQEGFMPFVVTVGSFVALGADLRECRTSRAGGFRVALEEPGPWFAALRGHRVALGPGRPWVVLGWDAARLEPAVGESGA